MRDSHINEMRWYSEISTAAFCESLDVRRILLQKRQSFGRCKRRPPLLEPSSAEFISALAAGIKSRHTLQVGCGLSTLTLAAAARATDSYLLSVHHETEKQRVVQYFLKDMGLIDYVEFISEDPSTFIPQREGGAQFVFDVRRWATGLDFVLLSGQPERYIELFDLLRLRKGAIVVADNALDDSTNDYIRHVRRQPGVDSSTLPLSRGIEVTKIFNWEAFNRGRKKFDGVEELINDKDSMRRSGLQEAVGLVSSSSSRFSEHSVDDFSHSSDDDAKIIEHTQPELMKSEMPVSGRESPVHSHWLDKSGYVTPTVEDSDKLEMLQHEVNVQQFESLQSLAEQWRIKIAERGGSSSTTPSPAEESRPVISNLMHVEPLSHFNDSVPIASPHHEVSEDLELESPQKMDLEDNGTSLPSSDASMAEKVAPEPPKATEGVLPLEDATCVFEEPTFQVYFQNDNGQTEVTVEGPDQEMLLFDLTLAFKETGISVKKAKISTQDTHVIDVFNVVDGRTKGPISEPRQEEVRKRILERLAEGRQKPEDASD